MVDDESIISIMLLTQLGDGGHQVECSVDGEQALDLFQPGHLHLAFVDLSMPGILGDELSWRFHEHDERLVTILVTGWKLEEDDPRRSAVDLYLKKPYVPSAVTKIVTEALTLYAERAAEGNPKL